MLYSIGAGRKAIGLYELQQFGKRMACYTIAELSYRSSRY